MASPKGFDVIRGNQAEMTWRWSEDLSYFIIFFSAIWCVAFVLLCESVMEGGFHGVGVLVVIFHGVITILLVKESLSSLLNTTRFSVTATSLHVETSPIGGKKIFPIETLGKLKVVEKPQRDYPKFYGVRSDRHSLGVWFRDSEKADFLRLFLAKKLMNKPKKNRLAAKKSLTKRERQRLRRASS